MDPIANFLTQIRNAYKANKAEVEIPYSKIKESIAKILSAHGYIGAIKVQGEVPHKILNLKLVYHDRLPVISHLKRVSRPSVRYYVESTKIPYPLSGKGLVILSTSKGLMAGRDARKLGIGGEIICQVW